MKKILYFLLVCMATLVACDDYDSWTTSPTALLTFSQDTVSFDTVITPLSSTTRTLIVYNPGDAGVRITGVRLREGADSHFRVNVDGQYLYGGEGQDFDVRRRDSIIVRAEVRLPEGGDSIIRHYEDELQFTLQSGVTQHVTLVADGMDVFVLRGLTVHADTTLADVSRPYVIYDSLVVAPGATLHLLPGTRLMFHDRVSLHVHGRIDARGTQDHPIVFRSDRVDRMFPYLPYDNMPNHWGGIHFYGNSMDNVMTYCDVHGGDYGLTCDSTTLDGGHISMDRPMLSMDRCIMHNIGGPGLTIRSCVVHAYGCQFSNTRDRTVDILGGGVRMAHCTIAQYYPLVADRGDALYMANQDAQRNYYDLLQAHFLNCVITGYAEDVIMGDITEGQDYMCDYLFSHCLLRTVASDDADRFVNVVYDNDKLEPNGSDHFTLFDTHAFLYDFTPDSLSCIRQLGDVTVSQTYSPVDMMGRSRTSDEGPDAGAYEYVPAAAVESEK